MSRLFGGAVDDKQRAKLEWIVEQLRALSESPAFARTERMLRELKALTVARGEPSALARRLNKAARALMKKQTDHPIRHMTLHEMAAFARELQSVIREEATASSAERRKLQNVKRDQSIRDLDAAGKSQKVIAAKLKISVSTVSRVLSKPRA
jgi:DNA-binding NarL/FixJ family response regulator